MAYINVDEVYILDNTGLQVDMATDIPFVDAGFTDTQKAQARKNIAAGGSNHNLLDNAYFVGGGSQLGDGVFPINQRGQTSYSSVGYGIDRWRGETGYASVALATDGLKFCSSTSGQWGTLVQLVASAKYLAGETVTISAIIDGTLIYTTYTLPSSGSYDLTAVNVNGIYINLYSPDGVNIQFRIYTQETTQHTIKAVKLEKGTVSTLANDPPPDFGEERRKCQQYLFIRDYVQTDIIGHGLSVSATFGIINVTLPVSMRSGGSPTGTFSASPLVYGGGTGEQPTFALNTVVGNTAKFVASMTAGIANTAIVAYAGTNIRLVISNEL